jgi:hypothetical protein
LGLLGERGGGREPDGSHQQDSNPAQNRLHQVPLLSESPHRSPAAFICQMPGACRLFKHLADERLGRCGELIKAVGDDRTMASENSR